MGLKTISGIWADFVHFRSFCKITAVCLIFVCLFSCKKTTVISDYYEDTYPQSEEDILLETIKEDENLTFWSDYPDELLAEEIIARMSDEELLSQLFMFGWAGEEPSKLVTYWVEERNIGSIKIFGWNTDDVEQVAKNISILQAKAKNGRFQIPLYVATDQEGGWIRHIKGTSSDTPGNLAIGASGYPADAYYSGYYIAKELRALGINMNFAPAVDLYTNHDSTVIGPRSFGENAEKVAVLGAAFAKGAEFAGVLSTAKHFPGHGDTGLDSHGQLPQIDIDKETLINRELLPFKYLIKEHIPAIMSGHLAFPQITGDSCPASLSRYFLTDILRNELHFDGLIVSDDMMMNGATTYAGSLSAAFTMAIEAGNNILCSSTTPQINAELWNRNIELMKTSADFKNTVVKSAERVLLSKLRYFKGENPVPLFPDMDAIDSSVPDKEGTSFFLEQACRSITLYKKGTFPLTAENCGKVLIAGQFQEFFDEGVKYFPNANLFFFRYQPDTDELIASVDAIRQQARYYDTVIILVVNPTGVRIAKELARTGVKTVIISGLSPVPVMKGFDWADTILMCYSYSHFSFKAAFACLGGDFEPQGDLPLKEE